MGVSRQISSSIGSKRMSGPDRFFDSNILLYLLSADESKANKAESLLEEGGHISVQVLNECASIAVRKVGLSLSEVREFLTPIRALCEVHSVTEETHDMGLDLAARFQLSLYDAMIAASALLAGCRTLLSEDMQHGQVLNTSLMIQNPFC